MPLRNNIKNRDDKKKNYTDCIEKHVNDDEREGFKKWQKSVTKQKSAANN